MAIKKQLYKVTVDVTAEREQAMGERTNEFSSRSAQIGVSVQLEDRGLETGAYAIAAALEEAARQVRLTVGPDDTAYGLLE